ncbi:MAG TPA: HNH endonuclease signature motif containing protein [Candidatus Limnocylindria bacterium]|nr:HNH endonuclease signature motif containing protein [Candidatus Limnocylindria bacterium]
MELWKLAAFRGYQLLHMLQVHGRRCWGCGRRDPHLFLELDHMRALSTLTTEERCELKWWLPFNLQLLCRDCHREKTATEARARLAGVRPPWRTAKAVA